MSRSAGLVGADVLAIALAFATAVIIAAVGAAIVRATTHRAGILDAPDPIVPTHTTSVATLGGIAVALGCLAGAAVVGIDDVIPLELAVGGLLFLVIGIVDDLLKLSVRWKLVPQCVAAGSSLRWACGWSSPTSQYSPRWGHSSGSSSWSTRST